MVARGLERVAALKDRGVSNANLYGATMLGGLGAMYVLPENPTVYELPENPKMPATAKVTQDVIQPVGAIAVGAGLVAMALNWVVARRNANTAIPVAVIEEE